MVVVEALLKGVCSFVWFVADYRDFIHKRQQEQEKRSLEASHSQFDRTLGWVHIPGKRISDFYRPGVDITINNDGLRGLIDYVGNNPPCKKRIVCLGGLTYSR